jgi:hypothetical protein
MQGLCLDDTRLMDAADPCATCGAPMACDQRYCLECGTRRAHTAAAPFSEAQNTSSSPSAERSGQAGPGGLAPASAGTASAQTATIDPGAIAAVPARNGGAIAVIAGVGVLLLAMGVGVLIGRAGSGGGGKALATPAQVISVASPGVNTPATSTPSTPTSTPTPSTPSSTKSSGGKSGKSSSSSSSSEVGQVPSKPAPPTIVPKAGGSGQSYEQKSKNLPNVVSTG